MNNSKFQLPDNISSSVQSALAEDIGDGDITAELVPEELTVEAVIRCKQNAIICGAAWVDEVYAQLDRAISIKWLVVDGTSVESHTDLAILSGPARGILTGERSALNFLQTLSATSTATRELVDLVQNTGATLLDTRKTIPGLRAAQKYAVRVGGGTNHRMGLFDAFLIKENHIAASGSIKGAISRARALYADKTLEIEVRNFEEYKEALSAAPDIIMLDNFNHQELEAAVALNQSPCKLEASGGIDKEQLVKIAKTGVDYISIGSLTKNCQAVDLTLLVE